MNLWIVGQYRDGAEHYWEFVGVFDSESAAVAACRDETYFVGPATLNEPAPHDTVDWDGAHYPLAEAVSS